MHRLFGLNIPRRPAAPLTNDAEKIAEEAPPSPRAPRACVCPRTAMTAKPPVTTGKFTEKQ